MAIAPIMPFIPHPSEERGLASSPHKYVLAALAIAAIAGGIFTLSLPAAGVLFGISGWLLWSAMIIYANRAAVGTKLEDPIRHLHSAANEVNAVIISICLFPLTLFSKYHGPRENLHGRPILMINGYLSFGATWHYQKQKLIEEGFGPIYTMNIGTGRSIKSYAAQVQEKAKKIQEETGRRDLILIGHSKGGLVGSYYAMHLANSIQSEVTDVVTINSPLAGTNMAYFGPGYDAYEMRVDSEFHRELREVINRNISTRFFHIASQTDQIVPASSALQGIEPSRQMLLKDTGHLGAVFSSRAADQISAWLKR